MPSIRNVSDAAISIPSLGADVEPGDTIDVPTAVADELTGRAAWRPAGESTPTKAEVIAEVDGDPGRAAVALEAELARGSRARSTLVAELEALIPDPDSAPADTTQE